MSLPFHAARATPARVTVARNALTVGPPRRARSPIPLEAGAIGRTVPIPWWDGRPLRLEVA